jgi:TM2 domain-containing membrane protein YozV
MTFACQAVSAKEFCCSSGEDSIVICNLQIPVGDSILKSSSTNPISLQLNQKEVIVTSTPPTDEQKKKKRISALFAFPFPFGFVGAHRVMLGTKPWIPLVYVATFGGCFGLLPLIDFCVILKTKDITKYENNPNLFMWIK